MEAPSDRVHPLAVAMNGEALTDASPILPSQLIRVFMSLRLCVSILIAPDQQRQNV